MGRAGPSYLRQRARPSTKLKRLSVAEDLSIPNHVFDWRWKPRERGINARSFVRRVGNKEGRKSSSSPFKSPQSQGPSSSREKDDLRNAY